MINRPLSANTAVLVATICSLSVQVIFLLLASSLNIDTTMRNIGGFSDDSNYINLDLVLNVVASDGYINKGYWWVSYGALSLGGRDYHEILLRLVTSCFAAVAVYFFAAILARLRCHKLDSFCIFFALPICLLPIIIGKEIIILALVLIFLKYFLRLRESFSVYTLALMLMTLFLIFLFRYFFVILMLAIMALQIFISRRNLVSRIYSILSIMLFMIVITSYLFIYHLDFIENLIFYRIIEMQSEGGNYEYSKYSLTQAVGDSILLSVVKMLTYPPPTLNSYLFLSYVPLVYCTTISLVIWVFSQAWKYPTSRKLNGHSLARIAEDKEARSLCRAVILVSVSYLIFLIVLNFEINARYKIVPFGLIYLVLTSNDSVFNRYYWIGIGSILLPLSIGIIYYLLI